MILLLNLGITFLIPRHLDRRPRRRPDRRRACRSSLIDQMARRTRSPWPATAIMAAIAVIAAVGGVVAANAEKTKLGLDALVGLLS